MNAHLPPLGLPVLDPKCLADLGETLDSMPMASTFLGNYLDLLPDRPASMCAAVQAADGAAAMDRAISLKVTSAMDGVVQLAALAEALEPLVCAADRHASDA